MAVGPSDDGDRRENSAAGSDEPSDEILVARIAKQRDKSAFAMIFDRYGARIKGYMIKSGADPELAEEAAQEALLAVWRKAELFDAKKASAPAWIFAIARNKRIDLIRRTARFEPLEEPDLAASQEPEPPAEEVFSSQERDLAVRAALASLNDDQSEIVRMAFYEGRPHSEIAEILGLPLGTVKSRLRLAFGKLRAALGAGFRDELLDL